MPAAAFLSTFTSLNGPGLFFATLLASSIDAYIIGVILAPSQAESLSPTSKQTSTIKSASEPHKHIYGRTIVGGTVVYAGVLDRYYLKPIMDISDPSNPAATTVRIDEARQKGTYLNICVAIAAHEIDAVERIYIGDDIVYDLDENTGQLELADSRYEGFVGYEIGMGTVGQPASEFILANTTKHYNGGTEVQYNTSYYKDYGTTTSTSTTITIDNALANNKLSINEFSYESDLNDDYALHQVNETIDGVYTFVPSTYTGEGPPTTGPEWSANHTLTNTAYVYFRYKYNADLFQGIPSPRFVVRGKKLYDPRDSASNNTYVTTGAWAPNTAYAINDSMEFFSQTPLKYVCIKAHTSNANTLGNDVDPDIASQAQIDIFQADFIDSANWKIIQANNDPTTWTWSDNWALAVRDYLTSGNYHSKTDVTKVLYGIGVKEEAISDANVMACANISDEIVYLAAAPLAATGRVYDGTKNTITFNLLGNQTGTFAKYEFIELSTLGADYYFNKWLLTKSVYSFLKYTQATADAVSVGKLAVHASSYDVSNNTTTVVIKSNIDIIFGSAAVYSSRFNINGLVDTSVSPINILEDMLAAAGAILPFTQGIHKLVPAVYQQYNLAHALDESNLAGGITVAGSADSSSLVNTITGTTRNPSNNWEEGDFNKITSSVLIDRDGGYELSKSIKLPFVQSSFDAQRLATIMLNRSRQGITAEMVCNLSALQLSIGEFIAVSNTRLGWLKKEFSIRNWKYQEGKVLLTLQEEYSASYDWAFGDIITTPYIDEAALSSVAVPVPITNLAAVSGTSTLQKMGDGTIVPRVLVTWNSVTDQPFKCIVVLEIRITRSVGGVSTIEDRVIELRDTSARKFTLSNVSENDRVTIKGHSKVDSRLQYTTSSEISVAHVVKGKEELPADINNLAYTIEGNFLSLSWDKNTEIDFDQYEIRKGGTDWATATSIGFTKDNYFLYLTDSYGVSDFRVKAIDTSGNYSLLATSLNIGLLVPGTVTGFAIVVNSSGDFVLSWEELASTFPISSYIIREGTDWATGAAIVVTDSTTTTIPVNWNTSKTYHIRASDVLNNVSTTEASKTVTADIPVMATPSYTLAGASAVLSFDTSASDLPVVGFRIMDGTTTIADTDSNKFSIEVDWSGSKSFTIKALNSAGFYSLSSTLAVTADIPVMATPSYTLAGASAVLSFDTSASDLPVVGFRIMDGATLIADTDSNKFSIEVDWGGSKSFTITALNSAGFYSLSSTLAVTADIPQAISANYTIANSAIVITSSTISSDLPVVGFRIMDGATIIADVDSSKFSMEVYWSGSKSFTITALNSAGQYSLPATLPVIVDIPAMGTPVYSFEGANIVLGFNASSLLPIVSYRVIADAKILAVTDSNKFSFTPYWVGTKNITISALNSAGFYSDDYILPAIVLAPNAPTEVEVANRIVGNRVEFSWGFTPSYLGSLPVVSYDIRYGNGSTYNDAANTKILVTGTDSFSRKVDWGANAAGSSQGSESRKFWITPIDSGGNFGASLTIDVAIVSPGFTTVLPQVIDNNILLYWTSPTSPTIGSLPISYYEIKKGATYGSAEKLGEISSLFFSRFETESGVYKYWITAVDSAGNFGVNNTIEAQIAQPPDYILYDKQSDDFITNTALANTTIDTLGNLILPIVDNETYQQHFDNNSWLTPNEQVLAGSPLYIQPSPSTASYTKEIDYGTVLVNLSVQIDITSASISGNLVFGTSGAAYWTVTVSTNNQDVALASVTDPWTVYAPGSTKVFSSSFRHIRYVINVVSDTPDDLLEISDIKATIDVKEKNDAGNSIGNSAVSTDVSYYFTGGTASTTFMAGETITQTTSGATGTFLWYTEGTIYLLKASGVFNATDILTGSTSSATYNPTSITETGGTPVLFTKAFVDITSITVTPKKQANNIVIAIYDFLDIPNPVGFFVYLLDSSNGARLSGDFSWSARGR